MPVYFNIVKIDVDQFEIIKAKDFIGPLQFDFEINFDVDDNFTSIKNTIKATMHDIDGPVLQLAIACIFNMDPDSWNEMSKPNNTVVIPVSFLQHLATITLGISRGIFHEKTAGTTFRSIILPLINLSEIIIEDMTLIRELPTNTIRK